MKEKDSVIVNYVSSGPCEIDIEKTIKKWNHLWWIAEWKADNSWRLIKYHQINSPNTDLKVTIAEKQAKELIEKLKLEAVNEIFNSAYTWRREKDWNKIHQYVKNKPLKRK